MASLLNLSGIVRRFRGRDVETWRGLVPKIVRLSEELRPLDEGQIRKTSLSLRYQALAGESLDRLLPTAFALVRESARRFLGMTPYDVQLLGGMAMFHRGISVMQTGEGKTLTAILPLYLAALVGKGAHLATANDYLAARDADLARPLFKGLGLSVGVIVSESNREQRAAAYRCDITYTTAKEIGFDFLRERLQLRQAETGRSSRLASLLDKRTEETSVDSIQPALHFCVVDEADSILIDEARTPLVVSSLPTAQQSARASLFEWCAKAAPQFCETRDFELESASRRVRLTTVGRELARKLPHPNSLDLIPIADVYEQLELSIVVEKYYVRDRHYIVRDGQVVIVDEFTGRLAEGRKWRAGLHQAIEARENLLITSETGEAARITIQDLFLRYERLAGMTGTVANSGPELESIYQMAVHSIPTHRPPQRSEWPDLIFATEQQKWEAIAEEAAQIHKAGRPVLIGTRSIDKSERLSQLLRQKGIAHAVLNAREIEQEAEIVAQAGRVGRVTVATNMAGRGTDIQLDDEARAKGGLHVICSELHDSSRIDRQLIGRCGRQGDPGSYRQFLSLSDEILANGLSAGGRRRLSQYQNASPNALVRFAGLFRLAQRRIERRHFEARKLLMYHERQRQEVQREMGLDPYLDAPS